MMIVMLVGVLMCLTISSTLATQGQITEVNPSGIRVASSGNNGKSNATLVNAGVYTLTESLDSGIPQKAWVVSNTT